MKLLSLPLLVLCLLGGAIANHLVSLNQLFTEYEEMTSTTDLVQQEVERQEFVTLFDRYLSENPFQKRELDEFIAQNNLYGNDLRSLNLKFNFLVVHILGYPGVLKAPVYPQ